MNKRIKELAEQAGAQFVPAHTDFFGDTFPAAVLTDRVDIEKLAKMVVQDCLQMADEFELDVNKSGLVDKIKQHFGLDK